MKRQKKHSISYFLLALLLSLSLAAGCSPAGGNAPSAPAAETATAETAAAEGSSAAAAEESAAAEGSAAADTAEAESNTEAEISGAEGDTAAEAAAAEAAPDYSDAANWAYLETENTDKTADVFFICPSVYGGSDDACNMSLSDADTKESFVGAINMEKGSMTRTAAFLPLITARSA